MKGIGNDIVALNAIDPIRTRSPRFYSKFISPAEQALYAGEVCAVSFEYFVWLLWSVKEAAYKCLQRYQPDLVFSPIKIQVTAIGVSEAGDFNCNILFQSRALFGASIIDTGDQVIHTVACFKDDFADIRADFRRIENPDPQNQSAAVRKILLLHLSPQYAKADVCIKKDNAGIPHVFVDDEIMDMPISLSHHDNWVAYAYQVTS